MKRYFLLGLLFSLTIVSLELYNSDFVFAASNYTVTDIGTLGFDIEAHDINNKGQVVGRSQNEAEGQIGYLWTKTSGFIDLGNLGLNSIANAMSINDLGEVVGYSLDPVLWHVFLWTMEDGSHDLFPNQEYQIGTEDFAINDLGWITGSYYNSNHRPEAFLWTENDGLRLLGLGGRVNGYSYATDINNNGQIVGYFESADSTPGPTYYPKRAFIWQESTGLQDIGHLGGYLSRATGINDQGQVVGYSSVNFEWTGTGWRYDDIAFLWTQEEGMVSIDNLGGEKSIATDINNHGQVVGSIWYGDTVPEGGGLYAYHAFIWTEEEGMIDLGTFGADSLRPQAINDRGQIVADATIISEGQPEPHVFLLTPTCNYDGICNTPENCSTCPEDCIGKTTGKPTLRYCCGDGVCENEENGFNCEVDCGAPVCDEYETSCDDGIDNDCDGDVDCNDVADCSGEFACYCKAKRELCSSDEECCSNKCRGKPGESQ